MALPASGTITMAQVATELGVTNVGINLNQANVRGLAQKTSGAIAMSDLYSKSNAVVRTPTYLRSRYEAYLYTGETNLNQIIYSVPPGNSPAGFGTLELVEIIIQRYNRRPPEVYFLFSDEKVNAATVLLNGVARLSLTPIGVAYIYSPISTATLESLFGITSRYLDLPWSTDPMFRHSLTFTWV